MRYHFHLRRADDRPDRAQGWAPSNTHKSFIGKTDMLSLPMWVHLNYVKVKHYKQFSASDKISRLFVMRLPSQVNINEPLQRRMIPLYPLSRRYVIWMARLSRDCYTKSDEDIVNGMFGINGKTQREHIDVFHNHSPIISMVFRSASAMFPAVPATYLIKYFRILTLEAQLQGVSVKPGHFTRVVSTALTNTAFLYDMLAQHDTQTTPVVATISDGLTCSLAALCCLCLSTRSFYLHVKFSNNHMVRMGLQKLIADPSDIDNISDNPAYHQWKTSSESYFVNIHEVEDGIWLEAESRQLGREIQRKACVERVGGTYDHSVLTPIFVFFERLQDGKDDLVLNSRSDGPTDCLDSHNVRRALRDMTMEAVDLAFPFDSLS